MSGVNGRGRPSGRPARPPVARAEAARRRARRRAQIRRRRLGVLAGLGALVVIVVVVSGGSGGGPATKATASLAGSRRPGATHPKRVVRSVRAGLVSWHLPSALSREVVVRTPTSRLWVLGGLDSAGTTVAAAYVVDPRTGAVHRAPSLAVATHDAAGTLLGHDALVLGGGTAAPASESQVAHPGGTVAVAGQLPAARSDARAATIEKTAYLVGGYSGPTMDPAVLATTNGRSFRAVATLPDPVRYPTLGVLGRDLYVFGGQGPSGSPVATIQRVDTATGRARVVGRLGAAFEAGVAGVIDGTLYLAGGTVAGPGGADQASGAVYAYEPARHVLRRVATLPVPVDNAGGTVIGNRLYVIGGEGTSGAPVTTVQAVTVTTGPRRS